MPNVVNLAKRTPATHMLVVRHRDRPGVLAHVFEHLRGARPQRAGNREHRLRRRRGRGRPHQPRRRAVAARARTRCKAGNADILDLQLVKLDVSSIPDYIRDRIIATRIFNFSAGPAVLPLPVLEEAQRDLRGAARRRHVGARDQPSLEDVRGRSWPRAEADLRALGEHPGELQGAVPAGRRQPAVLDGADEPARRPARPPTTSSPARWSQKAVKEAKRVGAVNIAGDDRERELRAHPAPGRAHADAGRGLRAHHDEQHDLRHRVARRSRRSAACRSSPTPRPTCSAGRSTSSKYGLIYAGAQKNLGPAGVTLVIIRDDLLARSPKSLPTMLQLRACTRRTGRCTTRRRASASTSWGS